MKVIAGYLAAAVVLALAGAVLVGAGRIDRDIAHAQQEVMAFNYDDADAAYANALAENVAPLIADLMGHHDAFLAPATTTGKNVAPRVAAALDVAQISEILSVEGPDTFTRPIYAGNAIATVESSDAKLVITVRGTAFAKAATEGGSGTVEAVSGAGDAGRGAVHFHRQVGHVVIGLGDGGGTKGIGLDCIDTNSQVCIMHGSNKIRTSDIENLVAALMVLKIFERWIGFLQHRSHCTIGNNRSLGEGLTE